MRNMIGILERYLEMKKLELNPNKSKIVRLRKVGERLKEKRLKMEEKEARGGQGNPVA